MITPRISAQKLKEISKLKLKKYREETNSFLIESEKILFEALNSNWRVKEIYLTKENFGLIDILKKLPSFKNCILFELSEKDFKKISNETTPAGIAALVEKKNYKAEEIFLNRTPFVPVFEKISDPGNLGTIIRSADWFGFSDIVISKESVEFTNPKVVKASMGSIFHTKIFDEVDLNHFLLSAKNNSYKIFGTSIDGEDIRNIRLKDRCFIVFGNESKGISKETLKQCDGIIKIPSFGSAESLNLAISASIIFYELRRNERS